MDFTWFPFDTQVCYFRAGSYSFNDQQMKFTITAAMEKPNTPIELNPLPYSIGKKYQYKRERITF